MADFKWDKSKYENADEIQEIIDQAIQYSKKSTEKEYKTQLNDLEVKFNGLQNQTKLNELLSGVPENNKKVISRLIDNDPEKIEEVKKEYSHLFENEPTASLKDILVNGKLPTEPNGPVDPERLEERFKRNELLTDEEKKIMWDYIDKKTK